MNDVFLSLGSNEGDRELWLRKAIDGIAESCGGVTAMSSIYETAAWGITDQPDFLNMVVRLSTSLDPHTLLRKLLKVEADLGRIREVKWGPRIIDIDILLYNYDIINAKDLVIPHPFLQDRRFTLAPLCELAPTYIHPVLQKKISSLLVKCPDTLEVHNNGKLGVNQ